MEWLPARPGLFIFGAGDDAIPMVRQARQLGWFVSVADGRSNLATKVRFPEAHEVHLLTEEEFSKFLFRPTDSAVVMTHSLEQDTGVLRQLMSEELNYIGVLGPRRRTKDMLFTLALERRLPESVIVVQTEAWMSRLSSPMGLDLGGDTPAEVAISVIAEIQLTRHRKTGKPLRAVRALREADDSISLSTP